MEKFISYVRVSTKRQGISGLGLEAQRDAIAKHVGSTGVVLAEFIEIESGKKSSRPQIHRAITECRLTNATLLIAKLDRLARNVAFIAQLLESGVSFVACDMPNADPFRLHIEAAIAEDEARKISARTRAALAVAKERGVKLGGWRGVVASSDQLAQMRAQRQASARDRAVIVGQIISGMLRERGPMSYRELAAALNVRGVSTPRGAAWSAGSVWQTLKRAG